MIDNMHQGQRLKDLLSQNGKRRVTEFASYLEISRNQVYEYFKMNMLHYSLIEKSAKFLNIDVTDFLPADGGTEKGQLLTGNVGKVQSNITELYKYVPFLSARAQAGLPNMSIEHCELDLQETYPVFLPNVTIDLRHIVIEVIGDSMEPGILSGALVLAEKVQLNDIRYESGGIYAVIYANRIVVKRIKTNDINEKGTLTLWSDNDRHGHITIPASDIHCMWRVKMKVQEEIR